MLSTLWLYTAWQALASARQRRFGEHRDWMLRNYALTFAAVTLRIYLFMLQRDGFAFNVMYPIVAWLAWVPNLLLVEGLFVRDRLSWLSRIQRPHRNYV